jgi:nicotinamidase/pyrazinamidase
VANVLLIIDFQNDFVPGGALPVPDGDLIAPRLQELLGSGEFDLVVATRDWHPADHNSFAAQGGPWPPHCVQGTVGAELHPSLDRAKVDVIVDAGYEPELEGYSAFEETELERVLREHDVDSATVVGLATDYCVRATALDAVALGYDTTLVVDGARPVELEPGDGQRAIDEMGAAGVTLA